jgi:thiol:disulfide interchange protein DsbD
MPDVGSARPAPEVRLDRDPLRQGREPALLRGRIRGAMLVHHMVSAPPTGIVVRLGAVCRPTLCAALALWGAEAGLAQDAAPRRATAPHAVVELIVDRNPATATREFWLGLRFELEQGWHVYWQNPGDSGGPPTVLWQPAPGLRFGDFQWPAPERLPLGPLVNYGYTNEVVLPVKVELTGSALPRRIAAQAKWIVCHDICVPGQARLSIPLPVDRADEARIPAWKRQIDAALAQVPQPAPPAWRASARASGRDFLLDVEMDRPAERATFFPLDPSQIDDSAAQEVEVAARRLRLRLRQSDQLTSPPPALRGVLRFPSGPAVVVAAPVTATPARPSGRSPR